MKIEDANEIVRHAECMIRDCHNAACWAVTAHPKSAGALAKALLRGARSWDQIQPEDRGFVMALARLKILELLAELGAEDVKRMVEHN